MGAFDGAPLAGLLAGNDRHVEELEPDAFHGLEDEQDPDVVTVCCADARVQQERMWDVNRPGTLFTPSTLGNQVWALDGEDRIVDGGVTFATEHAGVEAVAVVGHTGCGAITAAYEVVEGGPTPGPRGVDRWVEQLVPVVESAIEAGVLAGADSRRETINRLVERNVDAQVDFLRAAPVTSVPVYGFVYDFQGAYGDEAGRCYLVNRDGTTDVGDLAAGLPAAHRGVARRLTD